MRQARLALALIPLLAPTPARALCGGHSSELWELVARAELVVTMRLTAPGQERAREATASFEVVRLLKGQASGRLEVLLDARRLEGCLGPGPDARLLAFLVSGDSLLEQARARPVGHEGWPGDRRELERMEAQLPGRFVLLTFEPRLLCAGPDALEALEPAIERAEELHRAGAGEAERREFLIELAGDPRTRGLALEGLGDAWEAVEGGRPRRLLPSALEQARLARAFVQEPAVDESTGTLLSLLEGYDDPLFDRALLSAVESSVERADRSKPEAEAAAQTLAWLLANGEGDPWPALWSAAGVEYDPSGADETPYPELTRESLQQALRVLRARGQLRVSGQEAAGR